MVPRRSGRQMEVQPAMPTNFQTRDMTENQILVVQPSHSVETEVMGHDTLEALRKIGASNNPGTSIA